MKYFLAGRFSTTCCAFIGLFATSCVPNVVSNATQPAVTAVSESQRMQNSQAMTTTASNLRRLGASTIFYARENDDKLPPLNTTQAWQRALKPYATPDMFHNPTTKTPYLPNTTLSGKVIKTLKNPNNIVLGYEAKPIIGPNSPSDLLRPVLFVTGNVVVMPEKRWQILKKNNGIK